MENPVVQMKLGARKPKLILIPLGYLFDPFGYQFNPGQSNRDNGTQNWRAEVTRRRASAPLIHCNASLRGATVTTATVTAPRHSETLIARNLGCAQSWLWTLHQTIMNMMWASDPNNKYKYIHIYTYIFIHIFRFQRRNIL